jgi:rhodanese-related sulfurtransferase
MYWIKHTLIESLLILAIGALLALAANYVSPRGLVLARNYFPGGHRPASVLSNTNTQTVTGRTNASTQATASADLLLARLKDKGLQVVDSNQVVQIFRDPRREQELFVFVDARDEAHYEAGHVPGAFLFNHYRAENYLATLLPVCQTAEKIVVYCNGGNCEDSEFAATILSDAGVPKDKMWVYPGGFGEWITNGLPVETGVRQNGGLPLIQP